MALQTCSIMDMDSYLAKTYFIPNYQHEYTWDDAELEDFWNDLLSTASQTDVDHFFGQIVIHNDASEKRMYIIDGQQRTTTAVIFMRVLQCFFSELYKSEDYQEANDISVDIIAKYIGRYPSKKGPAELHLTLGELDREFFRENIQNRNIIPAFPEKLKIKSHEKLRRAFLFFKERIAEETALYNGEARMDYLESLYYTFTKRFSVLYMVATELAEAFTIFETLNARGKALETADLLKNYLFSKSTNISDAEKQWKKMIESLDQSDPTKYVRHFWNATHRFARDKELYRGISKSIKAPRESKEFLEALSKNAVYYRAMMFPGDDFTFSNPDLREVLLSLKILKAKSFYPVVLAMKQAPTTFSEQDIAEVLRKIEVLIFRNFTICGKVANRSEVFFANTALSIYDGNLATANEIISHIETEIVGDKEFADAFDIWSGSSGTKEIIRYILRRIHKKLDATMELNMDNSVVHIEHIMPQDISQWDIDSEVHETYLWRLGNLALLSGAFNISISNKPFNEKKQRYLESKIEPNKKIASLNTWGTREIEERQIELREYATTIWNK